MNVAGKNVVITGGCTGIGYEVVKRLLNHEVKVGFVF